jgi:hypothetical protein
VAEAVSKLGKEVVRVRYRIRPDTTGDPAIYFRILLTDAASQWATLGEVTRNITNTLEAINPYETWGLIPYFNFRSESEQAMRFDPEWA